jgi:hypothetical protein
MFKKIILVILIVGINLFSADRFYVSTGISKEEGSIKIDSTNNYTAQSVLLKLGFVSTSNIKLEISKEFRKIKINNNESRWDGYNIDLIYAYKIGSFLPFISGGYSFHETNDLLGLHSIKAKGGNLGLGTYYRFGQSLDVEAYYKRRIENNFTENDEKIANVNANILHIGVGYIF